ncbi:MAG: DNA replication/repair protein RecF [Clostridiales bacterium]|nr:DNA replication/repair protein RecF [Clostridiales bacterium]
MRILKLNVENYRNIENISIEPSESVNVIYGENAQGKTNLIEAMWLFTGCKSFRGAKDSELINFEKDFSCLSLDFFGEERQQNATIKISDKRHAQLNGVDLTACSKLVGKFLAMVFSPVHLNLVKGGPVERRKFIDTAICQLKPKYSGYIKEYSKVLSQRNALLKDVNYHSELFDTLEIWEDRLCQLGAVIIDQRMKYIALLNESAKEIYSGLSQGREEFDVSYLQNAQIDCNSSIEDIKNQLKQSILKARKNDIFCGSTSIGPHRDDLNITIDKVSARSFGSQGQQRSGALALKMSEASLIKSVGGEQPVALLDDVMSELDINRQDYILNHIDGWQVFITCCEPDSVLRMCEGKAFKIENGKLKV